MSQLDFFVAVAASAAASDASVFLRRLQRLFAYMTAGEHYEYSPRGVVNALRDSRGNRIVVGFQQVHARARVCVCVCAVSVCMCAVSVCCERVCAVSECVL